jgi:hypothetical protein
MNTDITIILKVHMDKIYSLCSKISVVLGFVEVNAS